MLAMRADHSAAKNVAEPLVAGLFGCAIEGCVESTHTTLAACRKTHFLLQF